MNPTQITVQCAATTNAGERCERKIKTHVYFKFYNHFCGLHGGGRQ